MRRRALLSAAALTTGLAGCLDAAQRQVRGRIDMDHAVAALHPADEPWIRGGLSADENRTYHAELFAEAPPDDADVFTEAYPQREESLDNDVRNDDYSTGFLLLFEVKSSREEAYTAMPTTIHGELAWAGIDGISLPLERYEYGSDLPETVGDADEVVCTMLARYEVRRNPKTATVRVYDEKGSPRSGSLTARSRL
ncbi:hypothetical protein [Halogeometricum limi]|uniref:Uncharacterized protein n=1 Tax=Halogeometricum limi TaxID=555875 RepID=A0A1I6IP07_9EURY|nr:hypothetical protein [Halogeometricum limi]SFR68472.1 hypothetical protein SAMN04488124_3423 [Halogeometricum limi]